MVDLVRFGRITSREATFIIGKLRFLSSQKGGALLPKIPLLKGQQRFNANQFIIRQPFLPRRSLTSLMRVSQVLQSSYAKMAKHESGSSDLQNWMGGTHVHTYAHISDAFIIFSVRFFFSSSRRYVTSTGRRSRERNERNGVLRLHISFFFLFGKELKCRAISIVFSLLAARLYSGRQRVAFFHAPIPGPYLSLCKTPNTTLAQSVENRFN